ncbi:MAG: hypothetical protein ACHP8A_02185 [Terriglobales bacterium]|jgi:hypothetical protein|nr:hypothetical protein [Terriglobales bacterium]
MRKIIAFAGIVGALTFAAFAASSKSKPASEDDHNSIIIVFKDGHQQTFPMADVARIEFMSPTASTVGSLPGHFIGKWRVGDGAGGTFLITLKRNGDAEKTIGSHHGTWTAVNGEARISWDDGWHDVIRKAGDGYEKAAFEPGRTFSDDPSNVADAKSTEPI